MEILINNNEASIFVNTEVNYALQKMDVFDDTKFNIYVEQD